MLAFRPLMGRVRFNIFSLVEANKNRNRRLFLELRPISRLPRLCFVQFFFYAARPTFSFPSDYFTSTMGAFSVKENLIPIIIFHMLFSKNFSRRSVRGDSTLPLESGEKWKIDYLFKQQLLSPEALCVRNLILFRHHRRWVDGCGSLVRSITCLRV